MSARLLAVLCLLTLSNCSATRNTANEDLTRPPGLHPIVVDGKWGFINEVGAVVIEPTFADVDLFFDSENFLSEGLTPVGAGASGIYRLHGYVSRTGTLAIAPRFFEAGRFSEGLAYVSTDATGRRGYIDQTGAVVIPVQFPQMPVNYGHFKGGRALVKLGDKYGYIDRGGELVIQPKFDWGSDFAEGFAAVLVGGKMGYVDTDGNIVIEPQFDSADGFSEGLAAVKLADHTGYIDKTGKIVIQPQFDEAGGFSDGAAIVRKNGRYGYIDVSGKIVIEPRFDFPSDDFVEGLAAVKIGDSCGYIDRAGMVVPRDSFCVKGSAEDWLESSSNRGLVTSIGAATTFGVRRADSMARGL